MPDTVSIAVDAVDNASDVLDSIGQSAEEMADSIDRSAKDVARLSERMTDLGEANVARAAIQHLDQSLSDGRITAEQYSEAVEKIQVSSGLASEASIAAADSLRTLNADFEQGRITADEYAQRLQDMSEESESYAGSAGDVADANRDVKMTFTELNSALELAQKGAELFKQAFEFGKEGAAIQRIGDQFAATAEQFGVSGDALIAQLDKVAGRTVDDEQLMQVATRAFQQELVSNSDELIRLFEIARASATRFGGDAAQAFEQIALATETGMVRSLKARGIVIDLESTYEDYAEQLGKTRKELTQQEEKQARLNAVLEQGAKLVEDVGDSVEDNLSKFQRFERQLGDLTDDAKTFVADALGPVLDRTEDFRVLADDAATSAEKLAAAIRLNEDPLSGVAGRYGDVIKQLQDTVRIEDEHKAALADLARVEEDRTSGLRHMAETVAFVTARETALQEAQARTKKLIADSIPLAIEYTQRNKELADLTGELAALDAEIAERGQRRVVVQQASVDTTQAFTEAQLQLTVAQERLAETTRKESESEAEFALRLLDAQQRVGELQGKVGDLSGRMGEHAVAVGGATKAQQEQRDALIEQIEQFQRVAEIERATMAFDALTQAYQAGTLSQEQYLIRSQQLNSITGLYTEEALKAATAQQTLVKSLTDPASEQWFGQLAKNKQALDGIVGATEAVAEKTRSLAERDLRKFGEESDIAQEKTKTAADTVSTALDTASKKVGLMSSESFPALNEAAKTAQEQIKTTADDVSSAADDASGKVNVLAREHMIELRESALKSGEEVKATFDKVAGAAFNAINNLVELRGKFEELPDRKTVTIDIVTTGSVPNLGSVPLPPGTRGQHGLDFIARGPGGIDSVFLPLRVTPGERVVVQTPQQQRQQAAGGAGQIMVGGDTVIINDRLALAQYYEQKRSRLLERGSARMR